MPPTTDSSDPTQRDPHHAVFDHEDALARMDGDGDMLREVLQMFLQDSPNMLARIDAALASGDALQLERAAHGLKGASATIWANAVTEMAVQVERAAKGGRVEEARLIVPALQHALRRLVVVLDRIQHAA